MTNNVSAAATGLPATTTRRRALVSLAGFGAALSLPKVAKAASLTVGHPDAVLIAHASMVEEMAIRSNLAWARYGDLDTKTERLQMPRPQMIQQNDGSPIETLERGADGLVSVVRFKPVDPADALKRKKHEAAVAEWERTCEALKENTGYNAAEELASDLSAALSDAVEDLASMVATTPAGPAAKARAAMAVHPGPDCLMDEREQKLFASVVRDVLAIGGAA